eukprot:scaffold262369_cov33-Tisochrysis_lutea.AAC.2
MKSGSSKKLRPEKTSAHRSGVEVSPSPRKMPRWIWHMGGARGHALQWEPNASIIDVHQSSNPRAMQSRVESDNAT